KALEPESPTGRAIENVRTFLFGRRLSTEKEHEERLGKITGLAIFASDNISSSAYATEETMRALALAGAGALALTMPLTIAIGVVFIGLLTIGNLRGIREAGLFFAGPTYFYVASVIGVILIGLYRTATGDLPAPVPPPVVVQQSELLSAFLILRAFSSGSVALTGTEAVANGVPAFKDPAPTNARVVLVAMGTLFGTLFIG